MRKFRTFLLLVSLASVFLAASCGPGNIDSTDLSGGGGGPSIITLTLGAAAIGNSGSTTASATVTDSSSSPLPNITVDFAVGTAGAGGFSPAASAVTDAAGVATVTFTAFPAGDDSVVNITATVTLSGGGTIVDIASLTIGAPPPPVPANMSLVISPLTINITGTATVTATATDAGGNPAYNTNITLTIIAGALLGSFDNLDPLADTVTVLSDANGQIIATFYAESTSGTVTIQADAAPASTTASLSITSNPFAVALVATDDTLTTAQSTALTATVQNVAGNPVQDGTIVSFAITAGDPAAGTFSSATATTVVGVAQVTFTASASVTGAVVVTASAGTAPVVSGTELITITQAGAGSIEFVSASPNVIGIQGSGTQDNSTVTFIVKDVNNNPMSGEPVDFTLYGPVGAYLGSGGTTDNQSTAADGTVTTILHSGMVAGPARIVASLTNDPAIITSSGNISIGGGVPSASHFDLAASRFNLEGLACLNVSTSISSYMSDRFKNYNILTGTSVSFTTEGGAIDASAVTGSTGIASATLRTQAPYPEDVNPAAWETVAAGLQYTVGTRTYNPRDGWVTVLVTTTGEETFIDENADGVYTAADTFTPAVHDLGEPFIDSDDSGTRVAGELFFDWPSYVPGGVAGTHQTGNTVWDDQIPIHESITLLFTGPPHVSSNTSRIRTTAGGSGNINIPVGGTETFDVYVSDINLNSLIGGTTVAVSTTNGTLAVFGGSPLPDGVFTGPAVFFATLTNGNTSGSAQIATLSAKVTWPSACGTVIVEYVYPGIITLDP